MARANRVFEANSLKENALTEGKHLGTRSDRQLSASLNDDSNDECFEYGFEITENYFI